MEKFTKQKCFYIVLVLFLITCGLLWYSNRQYKSSQKLIEEVEYYDSLNNYNKIYYSKAFSALKKENAELYDSLKKYKDKLDYVIQFSHEKEYNVGKNTSKPIIKDSIIHDTVPLIVPQIAKTYEYTSEPNDTFQYKLNVNSYTEPKWYSIQAKVKNKFTIVNKEENGMNHATIGSNNGGTISDVTMFHKKQKRTVWDRMAIGPAVTGGYDIMNKQFGLMVGVSVTFDLTKK
jgi:hypothetical protein